MKINLIFLFLFTSFLSFSNINSTDEYNLLWEDLKNYKTSGYKSFDVNNQEFSINSQETIIQTNNLLDFAIIGEGFFKVFDEKNNQILYTRNGSFKISPNRYIITTDGYYLYPKTQVSEGYNDQTIKLDENTIKFYKAVSIKSTSEILLNLYMPKTKNIKRNSQYFIFDQVEESHNFKIIQGSVEQSNTLIYQTIGRMYFLLSQLKSSNNTVEAKLFFLDKMLSSIDNNYILKRIEFHISKVSSGLESFTKTQEELAKKSKKETNYDFTTIPIIDSLINFVKLDYK